MNLNITVHCPRCQSSFSLPETLSYAVKQEVLTLIHQQKRILAMKTLMESGQLRLGDAKAAVMHIPHEVNYCYRCQNPIEASEVVVCSKCNSLILNWQ